jgi:hypothetical protein
LSAPATSLAPLAEEAADIHNGEEGGLVQVAPESVDTESVEQQPSIQPEPTARIVRPSADEAMPVHDAAGAVLAIQSAPEFVEMYTNPYS